MKTAGSRRGFTLTELVVALGILVLLMAMIMPSLGPMRRQARRRAAAASVAGTLRLARSMAIAQSAVYHVEFDAPAAPQPHRMLIHSGLGYDGNPVWPADGADNTSWLPEGIGFTSYPKPSNALRFLPDGSARGDVTVKFVDADGKETTVRVSPASGVVRTVRVN